MARHVVTGGLLLLASLATAGWIRAEPSRDIQSGGAAQAAPAAQPAHSEPARAPASAANPPGANQSSACDRDPWSLAHAPARCEQPTARAACKKGFCRIEPGCFLMGSPFCEWGRAKHGTDPAQVTLTHRFLLQQHEVTVAEWRRLGLPVPNARMPDGTGDCLEDGCPIGNITWFEALAYANLLSKRERLAPCYELSGCTGDLGNGMTCDGVRAPALYECSGYRLPTSAEWEYAARAGTRTTVPTGDIHEHGELYTCYDEPALSNIAWYCANAGPLTHPVGRKRPNALGLYDMFGNAGEWVGSLAQPAEAPATPLVDRGAELEATGLRDGTALVSWRGGAWNLWPHMLRAGGVANDPPAGRGPGIGFRLARTVAAE